MLFKDHAAAEDFRALASRLTVTIDAMRHDLDTYKETRAEHAGDAPKGTTYKHAPILPYALFLLFAGCRGIEARRILWEFMYLDAKDSRGEVVGEIRLPAQITKNRKARTVGLEVAPFLRELLVLMRDAAGPGAAQQPIFGDAYSEGSLRSALKRLRSQYGAPANFTWKRLRATCDTFLVNSPGGTCQRK